MSNPPLPAYRQILSRELSARIERNPRYSIRAFAKSLSLDSGALSQILSGSRVPSEGVAQKLAIRLELAPPERDDFLSSLADLHCARSAGRVRKYFKRIRAELGTIRRAGAVPHRDLSLELFRTIADWYHYAILELTFVEGFRSEPAWIAKRLGISVTEVKLAIERLKELGFLAETENGLSKCAPPLNTADRHLTSSAHKKRQRQILEKAITALEQVPIERRNHSAMTMAIDPALIPEAKRRTQAFLEDLCALLESGKKQSVYELAVCLFPLQDESAETTIQPQGVKKP